MTSQRDGFLSPAREILAKRAGQRCSNPDCGAITSGPHEDAQKAVSLGVAAHITAVEFQVLESLRRMPLGHAQLSALYDLDISVLEEFSSRAECQVAQILKPGEADRFGIVLSAPTLGMFAGWRFATLFKTNCGPFQGPEVEVWMPRPEILRPFATLTNTIS